MSTLYRRELLGVHPQPQEGKVRVGVPIPAVRISQAEFCCVTHLANNYSSGEIQLTVEHNIILKAMMVLVACERFMVGELLWDSVYLE